MPSRAVAAMQAVTRTMVSPERTTTEPSACLASRPVSIEIFCRPTEISRVCISVFLCLRVRRLAFGSGLGVRLRDAHPTEARSLSPKPQAQSLSLSLLLANAQAADEFRVTIRVLPFEVVEQAPAL